MEESFLMTQLNNRKKTTPDPTNGNAPVMLVRPQPGPTHSHLNNHSVLKLPLRSQLINFLKKKLKEISITS